MEEKYYHTKASVEEYINLAKDVNGQELINELKQHLPVRSAILELGSGPGSDWVILSKDYEVTGSDNSKEFLSHLKANYPSGTFIELDAVPLDTSQKFDGLYSNKVLHHLTDSELKQSIERQADLLPIGGIICHSFWLGEGSENFKGMFVNYHTEAVLRILFSNQFEILQTEPYAEFESDDSILLIGKKK